MMVFDKLAALKGWRYSLICIVVGLAGLLGHAPFFIWPITILVFAVAFRLIYLAETPRRAFWTGQWIGAGYFSGQVYWIAEAFIARGAEFVYIMPLMLAGLAMLLGFFWGLAGWAFKKFRAQSRWPYLTLAGLFLLGEMLRGHLFGGFPWNLPGYIFKAGGAMSQSVSLIGIYGLSLAVLIVAALIAQMAWRRRWMAGAVAAAILLAGFGYGTLRLKNSDIEFVDNVRLRIVNAPFSQKDLFDPDKPEKPVEIVRDHLAVTAAPGLENITHVIWPEGALDWEVSRITGLGPAMGEILKSARSDPAIWLVNNTRVEDIAGGRNYYNSTSAISFKNAYEGEVITFSDKKRLVPFGEIIPGGKWVEKLGGTVLSADIGSFTPAREKMISQIPGLPPGSIQICYEVIFSGLTPRSDSDRVEWILNQSNDAWFGSFAGPEQHANITRYRAIEEKVPIIRAAVNGYTGVIDPYGRYVDYASPGTRKAIDVGLPRALGESLPFKWINILITLLTTLLVLICPRVVEHFREGPAA